MKKSSGKICIPDLILAIIKYVCIISFTILCIYPFYYVIICSISDAQSVSRGIFLLPHGISFETYGELFHRNDLWHAFFISISRTVIGTAISVVCTAMLAFLMTRQEMVGRKVVYRLVITTMYLNAGLIPWYLTMKAYHLQNSFLLYILPGAISAYNMILIKTYMEQLPGTLEEAAILDGAGILDIFFRVVMPLSKPILATVTVFCAVGQWNSWQDNFFLASDPNLKTLQLILREYLNQATKIAEAMKEGNNYSDMAEITRNVSSTSVRMASVVVTMLPVMLVYPFAQKYFTKGIMIGAVKG